MVASTYNIMIYRKVHSIDKLRSSILFQRFIDVKLSKYVDSYKGGWLW